MFSAPSPLIRNGRAALLLVAVALLTPGRAEARCGHPNAIFKTNLIVAEASAQSAQAPTETPAPPKPCDGSNCSEHQDHDAPPPSTAPAAPRAGEAVLNLGTQHPAAACDKFARGDSSLNPIDRAFSVFHPPRA